MLNKGYPLEGKELSLRSSLSAVFTNWHQHNTLLVLDLTVCSRPFTGQWTGCLFVLMMVCLPAQFCLHSSVVLVQMKLNLHRSYDAVSQ